MADEYKVADPLVPETAAPLDPAASAPLQHDSFAQRLYDHGAGAWIVVPADKAPDLIGSGNYTYEAGITVPMISPEGERYNFPSEKAYDAIKAGFRPPSAALSAAADQLATEKSNQRIYGNQPLEAAAGGFLRGATLGGSDLALNAMGLDQGAAQVKDRNVGASLVGEAGGIAFSTLYGGPVGAGAKGAASAGLAAGGAALGTGIAGRLAGKALGSAAEGAYFGLGSGITEASLGHPDSVVDTLAAHVGLGALMGGVVGGVFGGAAEAKPAFDALVNRTATGAADAVSSAAKKAFAKVAVPVLERAGIEDAEKLLPELMSDPKQVRWLSEMGGMKGVNREIAKMAPDFKIAKAEMTAISDDIQTTLANASSHQQHMITGLLEKTGKNVFDAAQLAEQEIANSNTTLRNVFASEASKPVTTNMQTVHDLLSNAMTELKGMSSATALRDAAKLDLQVARTGAQAVTSQADEATLYLNIVDMLRPYLKSEISTARDAIGKIVQFADESLLTHPNPMISTTYAANKEFNAALAQLKDISDASFARTLRNGGIDYDTGKALKAIVNPDSRSVMQGVLNNFSSLGPEYARYHELASLGNGLDALAAKAEFAAQLEARIQQLAPGSKVNTDEVQDLFNFFGKPAHLDGKIEKLRELQASFASDVSPLDKAISIKRALGQDVTELEKIVKNQRMLKFYDQTAEAGMVGYNKKKGALGSATAGHIGNMIGGPGVGKVASYAGMLYGIEKSNAQNYVHSIANLQTASETGARLLSKATEKATEALTSRSVARVAANEAGDLNNARLPIEAQRERYKTAKHSIEAALVQPTVVKDAAPNVSKALQQRQQQVLKFLQQKMPADPFQQSAINIHDSGYMPSDFEVSKFNRYVAAADNPVTVLNSIAKGNVTPEEVETLKDLYPRVYSDLQKSTLDAIIEKRGDVTYRQKVELTTLFDIPTDYTLQSDFIGRMQRSINLDQGGRPAGSGEPKTARAKLDLSPGETLATATQKVTYGLKS